jgi:hypothetical protein
MQVFQQQRTGEKEMRWSSKALRLNGVRPRRRACRLGDAIAASAIKNEVVALDYEIAGRWNTAALDSPVDIEYLAARTALEVVMIPQLGDLVAVGLAGKLYRQNTAFGRQVLQGPVNRRDTE